MNKFETARPDETTLERRARIERIKPRLCELFKSRQEETISNNLLLQRKISMPDSVFTEFTYNLIRDEKIIAYAEYGWPGELRIPFLIIFVEPDFRKQGLATILVTKAFNDLDKVGLKLVPSDIVHTYMVALRAKINVLTN